MENRLANIQFLVRLHDIAELILGRSAALRLQILDAVDFLQGILDAAFRTGDGDGEAGEVGKLSRKVLRGVDGCDFSLVDDDHAIANRADFRQDMRRAVSYT